MELDEVNRTRIGEETENTESFGFVQKKAVIVTSDRVGNHRGDKIQLRPQEHLYNGKWVGPIFPGEHEKNDSNNDSAVREEEAEKAEIGKAISEVRCQHSLDGTADSPKIGYFKPGAITGPHRDDNHKHGPVAELHRQHLRPAVHSHFPDKTEIGNIIEDEQDRERPDDDSLNKARL